MRQIINRLAVVGIVIELVIALLYQPTVSSASDRLVGYFEAVFHTQPGGITPVDPRQPDLPRLRYLGTQIRGGEYCVRFRPIN